MTVVFGLCEFCLDLSSLSLCLSACLSLYLSVCLFVTLVSQCCHSGPWHWPVPMLPQQQNCFFTGSLCVTFALQVMGRDTHTQLGCPLNAQQCVILTHINRWLLHNQLCWIQTFLHIWVDLKRKSLFWLKTLTQGANVARSFVSLEHGWVHIFRFPGSFSWVPLVVVLWHCPRPSSSERPASENLSKAWNRGKHFSKCFFVASPTEHDPELDWVVWNWRRAAFSDYLDRLLSSFRLEAYQTSPRLF